MIRRNCLPYWQPVQTVVRTHRRWWLVRGLSLTPMSGELDQREFRIIFLILVDVTVESVYGHRSAVSEAAVLACASVGCRQFFAEFLSFWAEPSWSSPGPCRHTGAGHRHLTRIITVAVVGLLQWIVFNRRSCRIIWTFWFYSRIHEEQFLELLHN